MSHSTSSDLVKGWVAHSVKEIDDPDFKDLVLINPEVAAEIYDEQADEEMEATKALYSILTEGKPLNGWITDPKESMRVGKKKTLYANAVWRHESDPVNKFIVMINESEYNNIGCHDVAAICLDRSHAGKILLEQFLADHSLKLPSYNSIEEDDSVQQSG